MPLDLDADSNASPSEDSDEDGWMAGLRMSNTEEFFRPGHAIGGLFDGDSALKFFESRGFSRDGHTLAAGEDEAGPYFRLLEVSSGSCKRKSLAWGSFGVKKACTVDDSWLGSYTAKVRIPTAAQTSISRARLSGVVASPTLASARAKRDGFPAKWSCEKMRHR